MVDPRNLIDQAHAKARDLTPSVVALARVAKVTPKQFADAIEDTSANTSYLAEVMSALSVLFAERQEKNE